MTPGKAERGERKPKGGSLRGDSGCRATHPEPRTPAREDQIPQREFNQTREKENKRKTRATIRNSKTGRASGKESRTIEHI